MEGSKEIFFPQCNKNDSFTLRVNDRPILFWLFTSRVVLKLEVLSAAEYYLQSAQLKVPLYLLHHRRCSKQRTPLRKVHSTIFP